MNRYATIAAELERLKLAADTTPDGTPDGLGETDAALFDYFEENFDAIIEALNRATSTGTALRGTDMTPETLVALKGSIEKWRKIVEEGGEDEGWENCPLCGLFWRLRCRGCPVSEATRKDSCDNSPYEEWTALCNGSFRGRKADTPEKLAAARAELEFLRSLLPQEEAS